MGQGDADVGRVRAWPGLVAVAALATLPFGELIATNSRAPVPPSLAVWWLGTIVATVLPLAVVAWRRGAGPARRVATFAAPVVWLFFHQGQVASLARDAGVAGLETLPGWLLVVSIACIPMVPLSRTRPVQLYVALLAPLLLVPPALTLVADRTAPATQSADLVLASGALARTPNVYMFLVDGYARRDVILDQTGVDVGPFLDDLEHRGFEVADEALANYPSTFQSVSSMLEMDYQLRDGDRVPDWEPYLEAIRGDNAFVDALRDQGYTYAHAYTWDYAACSGHEDICIGPGGLLDETTWAMLRSTPLRHLVGSTDLVREQRLYSDPVTSKTRVLDSPPSGPVVMFAHLLSPHPPYSWNADCTPRHVPWQITEWGHPDAYGESVQCLNTRLLRAIDMIQADDHDAVIVVQGDHGVAFDFSWARMGPDDLFQRMPVLSALLLPEDCRDDVPERLTPVNTLRVVLACLQGVDPDLLPDHHFWVTYEADRAIQIDDAALRRATRPR